MNPRRLASAFGMTLRMLVRSRLVVLLLFVVPALFYAIVALTTNEDPTVFQLASAGADVRVQVAKRSQALVFIGLAAVGLLTAFLAMNLVQKDAEASQRLVLCGYRPRELVASRLAVLLCVVAVVAAGVVAALPLFFRPERIALVGVGFALLGWVYGCYGLLVGALLRRNLEGVLFVALLVNIDAGWLQNPLYYADAQNQVIIRSLPAYYPAQVSMAAAFTDHAVARPALYALAYGAVMLAAAVAVYALRTRQR